MVTIITDSTADLSPELIEKYNIGVVPLWVTLAEQTFKDDMTVTAPKLFALVEQAGVLPKTAAPSVAEFSKAFELPGESVYLGISSCLSASVANATSAAQALGDGKVRVIDSLTLSTGIGLLALKAADLRDQGCSADDIVRVMEASRSKVRMSFVIDTMKYLYMGGRCTALQSIVGGLLKIRPVIYGRPDGTLGVKDKVRGTRKRALESMLNDFQANLPDIDLQRVFVTHAACPEDAAYLAERLKDMAPIEELLVTEAGAVVSTHCGPATIGILYMLQ